MSFQSIIKFNQHSETYLTIQSGYVENAYDMVLSSVYSLLALLDFGEHRFDDEVIDHLKMRVEELRHK